jgi:hypothetical protein
VEAMQIPAVTVAGGGSERLTAIGQLMRCIFALIGLLVLMVVTHTSCGHPFKDP